MPAPPLPTGVAQAEVDELFAQIRADSAVFTRDWQKSRVPMDLLDQWSYAVANPTTASTAKTSSSVVKASRGTLVLVIVNTVGTPGNLVINDAATLGGANIGNQIYSAAAASLVAGQVISFNREMATGIVVSSMPTGGNYTFVYS
jgi:hypothetical protein